MAITRLMLTLSIAPPSPRLAEAGAALAAQLGAALEAMLFEDRRLLRLADAQLVRRVRWPSGEGEAPSSDELAAEFRLHESRLRLAVASAARAAGIASSFRIVGDEPFEAPLPALGDIVVVAQDGWLGHRRDRLLRLLDRAHAVLLLPSTAPRIHAAAIVVGPASSRAYLESALEFADRVGHGRDVDVVAVGASGSEAEEVARRLFAQSARSPRLHRLGALAQLPAWSESGAAPAGALVISAEDLPPGHESIESLLERTRRPLLLLREMT